MGWYHHLDPLLQEILKALARVLLFVVPILMIVPMLAVAGSLAKKKLIPPSPGTFPVHTPLFTVLLVGVVLIVGALTFFPALSLGPILEHLLMNAGKTF